MQTSRSSLAGRLTLFAFVPAIVALYLWVLVAPGIYGESGWGGLGVLFFLGPGTVLFTALVLGLVLASRARPRGFSLIEAGTVWLMWVSMLAGGFFFADGGDGPSGPSVFTHLLGESRQLVRIGEDLTVACIWLMFLSGAALLVQLVARLVTERRGRTVG